MLNKTKQNKTGFSLIEMIIAMAIFTALILSATKIFQMIIESQRSALAAQNLQENMRYVLEIMSKEIRFAQKKDSLPLCGSATIDTNNKVYNVTLGNDELHFQNKDDDCVRYYLDGDRLKITRGADDDYITPDEIKVSNLRFVPITDDIFAAFHTVQANVTIAMDVEVVTSKLMHQQKIKLQTTISSRYYE